VADSGIYTINNLKSGKVYIGSTKNFEKRWGEHINELRKGNHVNPHLQHAWNKYGESAFEFMVCEYVDDSEQLINREQYWLDFHRMYTDVYNIVLIVDGSVMSKEIRYRISEAKMGHSPSKETRQKLSNAQMGKPSPMKGRKHTEESKHNMSKAHLGHTVSEETRKNHSSDIKAAWARGAYGSEETRQRMSDAHKGNRSALGCKHSKEARLRMAVYTAKPYPAFVHRNTGEIIPAGINLNVLCKERGLDTANMWHVAHGEAGSCKGWILKE